MLLMSTYITESPFQRRYPKGLDHRISFAYCSIGWVSGSVSLIRFIVCSTRISNNVESYFPVDLGVFDLTLGPLRDR